MACGLRSEEVITSMDEWMRIMQLNETRTADEPRSNEPPSADAARRWPCCEPALTHFELGSPSDHRPTAAPAKRYTPLYGARKE
jgi:hypothetical protein